MMWKRLRKLVGGTAKTEAERAVVTAEVDYQAAVQQANELDELVQRIQEHGYRNHIGERVMAGIRGA